MALRMLVKACSFFGECGCALVPFMLVLLIGAETLSWFMQEPGNLNTETGVNSYLAKVTLALLTLMLLGLVYTIFFLVMPVALKEELGFPALLSRSMDITKGNRVNIFLFILLMMTFRLIAEIINNNLFPTLLQLSAEYFGLLNSIPDLIFDSVLLGLMALGMSEAYRQLTIHEKMSERDLAVFD